MAGRAGSPSDPTDRGGPAAPPVTPSSALGAASSRRVPRVLVDTSVWISAMINPHGPPARVIAALVAGRFVPVVSQALLDEIRGVADRPRIRRRRRLDDAELELLLSLVRDRAVEAIPTGELRVCRDPADDIILETAVAGQADYAVWRDEDLTRDPDLTAQLRGRGVTVLTVARFLSLLNEPEQGPGEADGSGAVGTPFSWCSAHSTSRRAQSRASNYDSPVRSTPMLAADVLALVDCLDAAGVAVWLDGGWGIDALLREQTRPHDDVDVVIPLDQTALAIGALGSLGFAVHLDRLPTRLVLRDGADRQVDVHPVVFDGAGTGSQRGAAPGGGDCLYPANGFVSGTIAGRRVGCLGAAVQMAHHTGYPPDEKDLHDVRLLHQRFGLDLPPAFRTEQPEWPNSPESPQSSEGR